MQFLNQYAPQEHHYQKHMARQLQWDFGHVLDSYRYSYTSNRAIVAPDTGAAINNTSTVTAGISNSRNRLFRHYTPPRILINYSVARIIATIFLLIFYYFQRISQTKSFCLRSYIRFCSPKDKFPWKNSDPCSNATPFYCPETACPQTMPKATISVFRFRAFLVIIPNRPDTAKSIQ